MEKSGFGLLYSTKPAFAWMDWEKPWKFSFRIAGLWAKNWTQTLQNKRQKCKQLNYGVHSGILTLSANKLHSQC